jgi:hypothetical protein
MTETVTSRDSTTLRQGHDHRRRRPPLPVRRVALGVATGLVLAASLLAGCSGGTTTVLGTVIINDHLYLKGTDGTRFEISVGKDATGNDAVIVTRVGE